jgi:hypothetical protein
MTIIENLQVASENSLIVEFSDGKIKLVNLITYFNKGIFTQLKDPNYFRLVKNNRYFIAWPNNQELSADTLYYS